MSIQGYECTKRHDYLLPSVIQKFLFFIFVLIVQDKEFSGGIAEFLMYNILGFDWKDKKTIL